MNSRKNTYCDVKYLVTRYPRISVQTKICFKKTAAMGFLKLSSKNLYPKDPSVPTNTAALESIVFLYRFLSGPHFVKEQLKSNN